MNKYINHDIINKWIHIHKKQYIIMSCCHNYAFTSNKEGDCPVQCVLLHFLLRPLCTSSNHNISNWTQSSHTEQSKALPCKLRDSEIWYQKYQEDWNNRLNKTIHQMTSFGSIVRETQLCSTFSKDTYIVLTTSLQFY